MTDYIANYFDRDCLVRADSEDEAMLRAKDILHPRRPGLLVVRPLHRKEAS